MEDEQKIVVMLILGMIIALAFYFPAEVEDIPQMEKPQQTARAEAFPIQHEPFSDEMELIETD